MIVSFIGIIDEALQAQVLEELRIDRNDVNMDQRELILYSNFLRQYFFERGYTLYSGWIRKRYDVVEGYEPQLPCGGCESVHLPYAFHGGDDSVNRDQDRIIFAQDSEQRHVAVKVVKDASDEYKVLRFLFEQGVPDTIEKFNHVIPVLDLMPFGDFWFADISRGNVLVNHFGRDQCDRQNPTRRHLRHQKQLTYALFDFELSTKFPSSWSDKQCRLPYQRSWDGTPGFVPPDTWQGEFDFDPFAWDVGAMGLVLADRFQHLTIHVPLLAPLFDKMLTRDVPRRFTAQQSLDFFDTVVYPGTSQEQLDLGVEEPPREPIDRWTGLDPEFLERWSSYRERPLPLTTQILRFICEYPWILHTIAFIRKTAYKFGAALN
ncbi:hypothetical protein H0H93_016095 [Arthromyces matolae]|nr:hypothetical protein H0H93_016095 [Arthromyces matolae]